MVDAVVAPHGSFPAAGEHVAKGAAARPWLSPAVVSAAVAAAKSAAVHLATAAIETRIIVAAAAA